MPEPELAYCRPPPDRPRWLVACLCAEWCGTCREYRPTLETLAGEFGDLAFAWIDVEDDEDFVDEIDVETFPTLMILEGERVLFYGPVLPGADALRRLLRALDENGAQPVAADGETRALAGRLARAAGSSRAAGSA